MIETDVDVMEGGSLSFQEVGVEFVRFPPAFDLLNWDADQHLLLIRTGTEVGAVHFRSEERESEPPLEEAGWETSGCCRAGNCSRSGIGPPVSSRTHALQYGCRSGWRARRYPNRPDAAGSA